jgi:tetratricopeptide (TPR) repeat protein
MNRAKHPRIASLIALACFAVGAPSTAQPRRGRTGAAAATEAAATTEIPTVATVAANVCIAPEAATRATECPAGAQRYGSRVGTSPPAAARATNENAPRPQQARGPEGRLDRSSLLRNQDRQRRSQDILINETRLTAQLVNRMRAEDPNRPPTLMRLAENYQELSSMANGQAEDLEENIHQARQANNAAEVTSLQARQTQFRTQAREFRDQLIATFENLVRTAPNFAQMDRALFYLGFALQEATRNDEALRVYRTLVQRFPNSPFVPNAYLSFGEFYFEQGNMENARQFYERVLAVQDESNQVYGYALYKMAWVLYNLQDHQGALQKFYEVIDYARAHPQASSVTALLRNARMELVTVYGSVYGNPQRPLNTGTALATFRRYAADEANSNAMFERLAELYQDNGQWANAIACYHALMESRATDDRFCFWQAQVARGVIASRPKPEQLVEVNRLVDVYNTFRQASARSQEVRNTCRNHAARVVFDVASHWHLEAIGRSAEGQVQTRGTRNPETMRMVAELYQKIVDEFPEFDQVEFPEYDRRDWPTMYRVRYYRADILRDQGNFEACGPAYDAVVESNPEGEYTEDAAYKAVLCYNDWFQQRFTTAATRNQGAQRAQRAQQTPRNQTPEQARAAERARLVPRDLNAMETGMVRAFTRYVCFVQPTPGQRDADGQDIRTLMLTIKYRRAYAWYTANHFEEASTLFREIAESDQAVPDPENLREISADLLLDSLNVMGEMWNPQRPACFDQMAETLPRLLTNFCGAGARAQREDFCRRVEELQCQVLRKKAESLASTRRFAEAARETIAIVRSHRECGRLDEMLNNAAIYYDAAFMLSRAIRVRERLVELFLPRNSIWAVRGLYRLAGNYHAIQVFGRAADEYERYADYVASHRSEVETAARTAAEQARARGSSVPAENPIEQAADALRQATIFRIGLGQDDRALANGQKFARYFGTDPQRRRVAAGVVYSLGQIYRDRVERLRRSPVANADERRTRDQQIRQAWNDLVRHYSDFMRRYAEQGTVDQKIQGAVALARGYWNLQDTRQASTYFQQAVTLWGTATEGQPSSGERQIREQLGDQAEAAVEASKDAVAEARFYLAEVLYQRFMASRLPTIPGTNRAAFDRWATNQLTPYIQNRTRLLEDAQRKYTEVIQMHVPNWEIAAAARLADMYYQFAVTIRTSPVPPDVQRNADLLDAWNVLRDERTQPFINTATTGFQACITRATQVHWFNEWSQLAERSLNAIDRGRFPLADEIRVEPNLIFSRPSNARPVYALGGQAEGADEEGGQQTTSGGDASDTPAGGSR